MQLHLISPIAEIFSEMMDTKKWMILNPGIKIGIDELVGIYNGAFYRVRGKTGNNGTLNNACEYKLQEILQIKFAKMF